MTDIVTEHGVMYSAETVRFTIPPSVPLKFGGGCQVTEIRLWDCHRELEALHDYASRPLWQTSENQNKGPNWKNIRFLQQGECKRVVNTNNYADLLVIAPPGECRNSVVERDTTLSNELKNDLDQSPARKTLTQYADPFSLESPSDPDPLLCFFPKVELEAPSPTELVLPVKKRSTEDNSHRPVPIPVIHEPEPIYMPPSPPGSPMRSRPRRKTNRNPFMPQIKEEEEPASRYYRGRQDATSSCSELLAEEVHLHPAHQAFCEMISGRFDRAELLLGAIDIRGRWVYQACLKMLRQEHSASTLAEKSQIACMMLRLPVLSVHRMTLRKRSMGWFAMAGATTCAFLVCQVLMIESNGEEYIRNAYRALKAKGGHSAAVPNGPFCGVCPNCFVDMPLHPFETKCRVCECDTAFDVKQLKLINTKCSHRCARCGFVEKRPKSNECGFCGTPTCLEDPIMLWY